MFSQTVGRKEKLKEIIRKIFLFGGYIFVGFIATGLSYAPVVGVVAGHLEKKYGGSPESYVPLAFLGILPFSYIFGGFVTGYLSQPFLKRRIINYVLISPALYSSVVLIVLCSGTIGGFFSLLLNSALLWNISCLGGVIWGVKTRAKKSKKDDANTPVHTDTAEPLENESRKPRYDNQDN